MISIHKRETLCRLTAALLCLCMLVSGFGGSGTTVALAAETTRAAKPTQNIVDGTRVADPDTMDDYLNRLLTADSGSRYAGRVWTDKTVFAYGDAAAKMPDDGTPGVGFHFDGDHTLTLEMETDGYNGDVKFNADFAHVFSALASSQVVNEYPPQPLDVMFVLDVSGSMGWTGTDEGSVASRENFQESSISKTVVAINNAIKLLIRENPDSRFGIVIYGSTAAVWVPLDHYTSGTLSTGFMDRYGEPDSPQGLHFSLTAEVTTDKDGTKTTTTYYADNAGQTNNEAHSKNGGGNRDIAGTGGCTTGSRTDNFQDGRLHVGHITNPQAGLAAAMDQFITQDSENLTWTSQVEHKTYARLPALIHLTDGQASDLAWIQPEANDASSEEWKKHENNWNKVNWNYDLAYNSTIINEKEDSNNYYNASQLTGHGDAAPVIFQTLITAAYYKSAVEAYYNSAGVKDQNGNDISLMCYSIYASDENDYNNLSNTQVKATIDAILGPEEHFTDDLSHSDTSSAYLIGTDDKESGRLKDTEEHFIDTAYELFKKWQDGKEMTSFVHNTTSANKPANDIRITLDTKKDQVADGEYSGKEWNDQITPEAIEKNINYVPEGNFYQTGFADLDKVFESIIELLLGQVFVPISGSNDADVGNSITYQDPIGEYMEVKNGAITATPYHIETAGEVPKDPTDYDMAILLFGEMHGLVRTGVYDYQWNDAYMLAHPEAGAHGVKPFPMGWYYGDDPKTAQKAADDNIGSDSTGTFPKQSLDGSKTYDNATQARADGWVYRLDFQTMIQFVSIADAPANGLPNNLSPQIKNTTYTVYRFAGSTDDRNALRRNPIYGEVPQDIENAWKQAYQDAGGKYPDDNKIYAETPGVYRLSDIRVWVEDTSDFVDESGAITPNTGYDRSLYANIPAAAVPTELAEITLGKDAESDDVGVLSYKTNLGSDHMTGDEDTDKDGNKITLKTEQHNAYCYQSTPLRLFYAVGLEDDLILRDADGNDVGVDFNKISPEYIQAHTVEGKSYVWFISNFYSNTPYEDYVTDTTASRTRGDPTVTFSPSEANRYYVFQKPLPLYAHAYRVDKDGNPTRVDGYTDQPWPYSDEHGNGSSVWEGAATDANGNPYTGGGAWTGGQFMGVYTDGETFEKAYDAAIKAGKNLITDDHGTTYPLVENGIVFQDKDLLDHVTSVSDTAYADGSTSFSSDDYFFLLVEYYMPEEGKPGHNIDGELPGTQAAHEVRYAVARKGSEFGSAFNSSLIDNGDMLCWTDVNNRLNAEFDYFSRTDTGDNTRGEPTFEALTYKDDELENYLKNTCGITDLTKKITVLDADNNKIEYTILAYWQHAQEDEQVMAALTAAAEANLGGDGDTFTKKDFDAYFRFAVAARPGGIRAGNMANNRLSKTENTTSTSYSYYLPTISDNSGTDNNVIINNYLGNNGRMEIANEMIHVTKMLSLPGGEALTDTDARKNEAFNFQVFLKGVTGAYSAVRTRYNEYGGVWERELATIDVITDSSDLVQTNSNTRALFVLETTPGTVSSSVPIARQVAAGDDGRYYYANDDGSVGETPLENQGAPLYYLYLPSNGTTETTQHVHRLYQAADYSGDDHDDFENLDRNGTTTFVSEGQHAITGTEPGVGNQDSYRPADEAQGRPAGTRTYWSQDAELIPMQEVMDAEASNEILERVSGIALESISNGGWTHNDGSAAHKNDHKELTFHTFVVRKPSHAGSATNFTSPYLTRSQYLTMELNFGALTGGALYDTDTGNDLFRELDEEQIKASTAEFTLKHGEGLLLTGLADRTVYRFTEKLTAEQLAKDYALEKVEHVQNASTSTETPKNFTGVYSVYGDSGLTEEQSNFVNAVTPLPGSLTVRKTVEGNGGSLREAFTFRVELSDKTVTGKRGDMTFTQGVAMFTLKSGESRTATGLPANVEYTVTEAEANLNGYATSADGATGAILPGETALASFVNRRAADIPMTGDGSNPLLWAALALACAAGALVLARRQRKAS